MDVIKSQTLPYLEFLLYEYFHNSLYFERIYLPLHAIINSFRYDYALGNIMKNIFKVTGESNSEKKKFNIYLYI